MFGVLKPLTGGDDIVLNKAEVILGRSKDCDVTLRFSDVSGRHCRLVLSKGYWYVIDLRSTNGTRLNGLKVNDFRVDPGAKLTFGTHEYRLVYDPMKNGNDGMTPPDFYETDVFSHSLLESAGLAAGGVKTSTRMPPKKEGKTYTQEELEEGVFRKDYSGLTLDDIKYDR